MEYLIKTYGLESVLKYTAEYIKAPKVARELPMGVKSGHLYYNLGNLFEFSPESVEKIAPFRRVIDEARRNASIQASQKSLRLLLESKFGPLSEELVSQFEAVHDVDELDRLYKLALQSQTLEEIGLHERKDT